MAWHGRGENDPEGEAWWCSLDRQVNRRRGHVCAGKGCAPITRPAHSPAVERAPWLTGGALTMLYRTATANVNRDITLIRSTDQACAFPGSSHRFLANQHLPDEQRIARRHGQRCAGGMGDQRAGFLLRIDPETVSVSPIAPSGPAGGRKHPTLAASSTRSHPRLDRGYRLAKGRRTGLASF